MSKGKNVFKYGEKGDKYYIILSGTVSINIPQNFRKSILISKKQI